MTSAETKFANGGREQTLNAGGSARANNKRLATLIIIVTAITPVLVATLASNQSQQNSILQSTIREVSPPTSTYWAKTYGGSLDDRAYSVQQTADGGYVVAGYTTSFGAGGADVWVLKLNSTGAVTWQKTYGGTGDDFAYSVQQTADGGYVVAGYTTSFGAGGADVWVLKLNSTGSVTWQKTYGGSSYDVANSVQQTADGGYIVAGYTESFGAGNDDVWVLRLNSIGGVTWQRAYGGSYLDYANFVQQTADGGYIVAGYSNSFGAGQGDVWVLRLNSIGGVTWQRAYGGSLDDGAYSVQQTADGGYIVAGYSNSFGAGSDDYDSLVLKLNSTGYVTWQRAYGGSYLDYANFVQQTTDGGYIVAGGRTSIGMVPSNFWVLGTWDSWILKLNSTGSLAWEYTYGGGGDDRAYSVQQTADGGYVVAGYTTSFGAGGEDFWVVKLDASGYVAWDPSSDASTQTTSITPTDSNVTASWTSATPGDSAATVTSTLATVQDTRAIMTSQSGATTGSGGGGSGGDGSGGGGVNDAPPLITIALVPIALVLTAMVVVRARRIRSEERSRSSWNEENTEVIDTCRVCNLSIYDLEGAVWCPFCGHVFHRVHILEWVHVKGCCPVCKHHLTEEILS